MRSRDGAVVDALRSRAMRKYARWIAGSLGAMTLAGAASARADTVLTESQGGHSVRVDRAADGALSLRVDAREAVAFGRGTVRAQRVAAGAAGALVVRVEGELPFGAVIAGANAEVLFAGSLAWHGEDPGERVRSEIVVRDLDGDGHDDVVVGERHEDLRLCGLGPALVDARAIDPRSSVLARVTLNPLRADLLPEGASIPRMAPVNAVAVNNPTASSVRALSLSGRVARGVAQPGAPALFDRIDTTTAAVARHDVLNASLTLAGFALERLVLVAPPAPAALPRRFTVLFDGDGPALDVTVPPGIGLTPGSRVAVPIVPPRNAQCASIVLGEPGTIADIDVATALDREADPAAALVARLSGREADRAALLLGTMGDAGIDAVASAIGTIPLPSARAALRLLANTRSTRAGVALVAAMARPELEADARAALVRLGPPALEALSTVVSTMPRAADVIVALRAPLPDRLRALAVALAAPREVFRAARSALRTAVEEATHTGQLDAWLTLTPDDPGFAARALTLAAESARDDAQRAAIAARARTVTATSFDDRFRLLFPLAGDDAGRALVVTAAASDDNADVRAEAVRALAGRGVDEVLTRALADRVPRVRVEAARSLAGREASRDALRTALRSDTWPSVRAQAATSLGGEAGNATALIAALDDPSVVVVRAALAAVARTPGIDAARLMTFAEDDHRNPDLRADALHIIASQCVRALAPRFEALARHHIDPVLPPPEQAVGHEALAALAHLDPPRARAFLRASEANAFAVAAVERAARNACPAR